VKNFYLSTPNDHNILIGKFKESDKELFFGPLNKNDTFKTFPKEIDLPELLKELGFFKSKNQARKNIPNMFKFKVDQDNRCLEIPEGFSDYILGKKNQRLTILKITI
jgi:hypothetical protein